jgi:hypothetical protein
MPFKRLCKTDRYILSRLLLSSSFVPEQWLEFRSITKMEKLGLVKCDLSLDPEAGEIQYLITEKGRHYALKKNDFVYLNVYY